MLDLRSRGQVLPNLRSKPALQCGVTMFRVTARINAQRGSKFLQYFGFCQNRNGNGQQIGCFSTKQPTHCRFPIRQSARSLCRLHLWREAALKAPMV
jgi:hypothetical protein